MATFIISGEVQGKRISDLTERQLAQLILSQVNFCIDDPSVDFSEYISGTTLQNALGGLYRPAVEPVISASAMSIDLADNSQGMFEPRAATATRAISSNFTLSFANVANAELISCVFSFTGTVTITMPSDVEVSNPSSLGTWDDALKELEIAAVTADIIEFQFLRNKTESTFLLKVAEVAL